MHIDVRVWWVKNTPSEFASHLIIARIAQVRNIHCGFALNAAHVQKKKKKKQSSLSPVNGVVHG